MIENVFVINKLSQMNTIKFVSKLQIMNELILYPVTIQKLSMMFGLNNVL